MPPPQILRHVPALWHAALQGQHLLSCQSGGWPCLLCLVETDLVLAWTSYKAVLPFMRLFPLFERHPELRCYLAGNPNSADQFLQDLLAYSELHYLDFKGHRGQWASGSGSCYGIRM